MLARRLLSVAVISAAVGAVTTLPAMASDHPHSDRTARVDTPACVDLSNNRGNGTQMYLWQCQDNNPNQKFVFQDGLIKVEDTIGTGREMCLDASNNRANGTRVYQWQCLGNANQLWAVQRGLIILRSTLNSGNRICLDVTNGRANGAPVYLWQCVPNANQTFVIDNGQIAVKDTLL
ncbi:ricin-type beta-trefoil lectin domain protein [Microbispora sp. NBC_01189]|uniref:ricin-type beta-trefoil lectin domain protein n=1 Tax=Microbispora sp. NBC_01189 TaxID=2903583 RepID=UPI002E1389C4|nr:ricin-type beta-trefoil lectin domain protein [Microbispora sp. NBC_01189]